MPQMSDWGFPAPRALLLVLLAFALSSACAKAQEINQLQLPEGYRVVDAGYPGELIIEGSGPPLILIPGQGFSAHDYQELRRSLSPHFKVHTITVPGFGATSAPAMPPEGTSYAEQTWIGNAAEGVRQVITSRQLESPLLVAHLGLGTHIATRVASQYPDLVSGVVLLSGEPVRSVNQTGPLRIPADLRAKTVDLGWAESWFRTVTRETWDENMWPPAVYSADSVRAGQLWDSAAATELSVSIRYLCEFMAVDMSEKIASLKVPVLIVQPGFDDAFLEHPRHAPAGWFFHDSWEGVVMDDPLKRVERVPGVRMFSFIDDPEQIEALITRFSDQMN